jgi:hypothetical protein
LSEYKGGGEDQETGENKQNEWSSGAKDFERGRYILENYHIPVYLVLREK